MIKEFLKLAAALVFAIAIWKSQFLVPVFVGIGVRALLIDLFEDDDACAMCPL